VAVSAATVHLPRGLDLRWALVLSLNAGVWSGAVVALAGSRLDLLKALPCVLVFLPAAWIVGRRAPIVVKVVSSWLIAVAVLAATLQFLPVTPGYLPDHME
jgi:glucan phosphoethanolaminetransferase (alkaline phosphatase superfamily)